MQPTCAVTNKVVFIAKTTLEELTINAGVSQTTDILLYDREDLGRKPNILKTYKVSKIRIYYLHDDFIFLSGHY